MRAGAEPRDLSRYTDWRASLLPENEDLFAFYGTYLMGQSSGLSAALPLESLRAAMEIEGVQADERRDLVQRCLYLHSLVIRWTEKRK